ncbi:ubiquitin carboxyl-terminal hydrolase isozyme L3 [Exaiptasia diaphana]|uniref:Ubiquitin carboxyl-terminal hydrolase n=1 Tax=Exaiptasia diaphana TaxID=2652724 RepID=A0A913XYB0_EXADI|nr:ubiquitin carboxyl-terminal hydrolase isozyme L3 [Exaiptasia diaphana]KXJ23948.1 Ubiquitin carboxyl-terminal hydrolase isozyme L3 [Exaiptasia diaphana]
MATRWLPLESNPDVMNQFIEKLGVKTKHGFVDVFGFDDDLLCMVPQPVYALLLLFPCNDKYEKYRTEQTEKIKKEGQEVSSNIYYMKQTVGNACGTVAIIHSIANNIPQLDISDGVLKKFIDSTKSLSPDEKAEKLENDESISVAHEASAQEGQTEAPSVDDKVDLHFVALVHKDGHLYELDGRKDFPINHGKTTDESFLKDGARVCQEFMKRDPDEVHFTVVALCDV